MMPTLEWTSLTVAFGWRRRTRTTVVDRVTLSIDTGEVMALVGPNGSGKTTAIRATLGLVPISAGDARVFGTRLVAGSQGFRDVVYVPEQPYYHDYLTVEEAVRYYARLRGRVPSDSETTSVLERLQLGAARHTRLASCSKGTKQKLGLSACLLTTPRLLVLDEPMRGLDPAGVRDVREIITGAQAAGTAVLLCSHVLSEVEQLATRVAILAAGRLVADDAIGTLVSLDTETYEVDVSGLVETPAMLTETEGSAGRLRGLVRTAELHRFLEWCRSRGAVVTSCRLRRRSLEDSVMAALSRAERRDG